MSRFNNPNLFRFGYNLNWKNNLINLSVQDSKRFLFEYNLLEKAFVKYNCIILRNFFNHELFHHYLLVYKARSHRIFKKRLKIRKLHPKKKYFVMKNLLKTRNFNFFFYNFFFCKYFRILCWFNLSFRPIINYMQFVQVLIKTPMLVPNSICSKLFFILFMRGFLSISALKFKLLKNFQQLTFIWRNIQLNFFFSQFFFFIYFVSSVLLRSHNFIDNKLLLSKNEGLNTSSFYSYNILYLFFCLHLLGFVSVFLKNFSNMFGSFRNNLCLGSVQKQWARNQFLLFLLKQKLYNFVKRPFNFTVFFWNKRDRSIHFGGYTVQRPLIGFLKSVYFSVDFIKQRNFFFFKDTLYLLFLSIFFINPRVFTKHLSRLFMLMRRHKDLFSVLGWILSSPSALKWLQLRLYSLHLVVKGRIEGATRTVNKNFGFGRIPRQLFNIYLIYSLSSARTWYGSYSVRLWFWFDEETVYS